MPHGEPQELLPEVFWLQGTVRMGPGVIINRIMTIVRHEGELTLINAIRPTDPAILDALGTVRNVVKIGVHGMDDAWFADHYGATLWAPEGLPGADKTLVPDGDVPVPFLKVFAFELTKKPELAVLVEQGEGLLVTCDSVQNWPNTERCSLLAKGVTWAFGFTARPAQIGPPWRKLMTPDGGSLEPDFRRLVDLPFDHLVGGHGAPLVQGAREALRATVDATF